MARGGYFQGGDYVPYQPGALSGSSATSAKEFRKQETIVCPNCKREVPLRDKCIFCDNVF